MLVKVEIENFCLFRVVWSVAVRVPRVAVSPVHYLP